MIDIEIDVLDCVREYIEKYRETVIPLRDLTISSEAIKRPASFPFATVIEKDNATNDRLRSTSPTEDYADLMYEVNVYSNAASGKKSECRTIASFIDEAMQMLGFTRVSLEPLINLDDSSIYRMVGRYQATVSSDRTIYRR
jgi:hypothetical protein